MSSTTFFTIMWVLGVWLILLAEAFQDDEDAE